MVQAESKPQVIMMRAIQIFADLFQYQIARYFEEDVAHEKQTGAQTECGFAKVQLVEHLQLGEADVDPVQIGGQVTDAQERNQLPGDLSVKRLNRVRDGGRSGCIRNGHGCLLAVTYGYCMAAHMVFGSTERATSKGSVRRVAVARSLSLIL